MSDIVERLRSYLPLGDGSLWSQSSKDYAIAADTIEQLRALCNQMGDALVSVDEQLAMRSSGHVPTKEAIAKWQEWKSTKEIRQGSTPEGLHTA